jgi:hypothetical protein
VTGSWQGSVGRLAEPQRTVWTPTHRAYRVVGIRHHASRPRDREGRQTWFRIGWPHEMASWA